MIKYKFDLVAFLTAVSSGSLAFAFAAGGTRWVLVGAVIMALATVFRSSLVAAQIGADAPAKTLSVQRAGDSVPILNGNGHAVGQVQTQPPGTVTTPFSTRTKEKED